MNLKEPPALILKMASLIKKADAILASFHQKSRQPGWHLTPETWHQM